MLVIFESKKEVVKEIIKHTKGGRGGLFIPIGDLELDEEELSEIPIGEMSAIGEVNVEV